MRRPVKRNSLRRTFVPFIVTVMKVIPHPIPYQGSKRALASQIISFIPEEGGRLIEPFAGSAAISLAFGARSLHRDILISDAYAPLMDLWRKILNEPERLSAEYDCIWQEQFNAESSVSHFFHIREGFNSSPSPAALLYLLARCVKNSVRFNSAGQFNQSPDKRRNGTHPKTMSESIMGAHRILKDRTSVATLDYQKVLDLVTDGDIVYLDPPYQGVSGTRDNRYFQQLRLPQFIDFLRALNDRRVRFIVSFDGMCGDRSYGAALPGDINAVRFFLDAGRSSQSTLVGRAERTVESLYVSMNLLRERPTVEAPASQPELFPIAF